MIKVLELFSGPNKSASTAIRTWIKRSGLTQHFQVEVTTFDIEPAFKPTITYVSVLMSGGGDGGGGRSGGDGGGCDGGGGVGGNGGVDGGGGYTQVHSLGFRV